MKKNAEMPKVSVVVPVYNNAQFLHQALDSVVNQTLKNIEIIIVNDGSTDASLEIINEYASKDSRIIVIDQPNGGLGNAINNAIAIAKSEYVAEMDSDDYISLEMYEELYKCAKVNDLDIAISNYYEFTGHDITFQKRLIRFFNNPEWYNTKLYPYMFYNNKLSCDYLQGFAWCVIWTSLYRREFLIENNIRWNENVRAYSDTGFWVQTRTLAKKIMYIDNAYYFYRQDNSKSTINNFKKFEEDIFGEHFFIKKFLIEKNIWSELKDFYIQKIFYDYIYFALPRLPYNKITQFFLKISAILSKYITGKKDITQFIFKTHEWELFHKIINEPIEVSQEFKNLNCKLSIIIIIYNAENFLRNTLEYIENRSLSEIEIIIVDNGSTDNSLQIANEFAASNVRIIIITEKNLGINDAKNVGIDAASGEYLLLIDSYDKFDGHMIVEAYNAAVQNNIDYFNIDI